MKSALLALALREPQALPRWSLEQWELLVRQARGANLLARLGCLLEDLGALDAVPPAPRAHLEAARTVARAQEEALRREVHYVRSALSRAGVEAILLKGAAYVFAGLPAARGRLFSDIDLLVPRAALGEAEAALMLQGWATTHHHPYDQRYYRRWMHELPPLQHASRATVLDVHHAIVPPTSRMNSDPAELWAQSRPVPDAAPLRLLAPTDMVLHSATHLFLNEEFSHGFRDLADIDSLLRHYGGDPGFWERLPQRAATLGLIRPLYYALRYAAEILETPIPGVVRQAVEVARPPLGRARLMDGLFLRVLQPDHPSTTDSLTRVAREALYVRSHWLRMPPLLLAYHLTAKALRREEPAPAAR